MRCLKHMLAGVAVLAALQTAARAEETVCLKAPYAYGLLASATCGKGDAERLKALVTRFAKIAGATRAAETAAAAKRAAEPETEGGGEETPAGDGGEPTTPAN